MTHEQKPESAEFRTREEQIETMTVHYMEAGFPINAARKLANDGVAEAEARGAAEQRRKDAEGAEPVAYRWLSQFPGCEHWLLEYGANVPGYKTKLRGITPLYTRPANVAALEARVKELEAIIPVLTDLVRACEEEFTGPNTGCDADEDAVGASAEKDMVLTFGHIRRGRRILDTLMQGCATAAIREGGEG